MRRCVCCWADKRDNLVCKASMNNWSDVVDEQAKKPLLSHIVDQNISGVAWHGFNPDRFDISFIVAQRVYFCRQFFPVAQNIDRPRNMFSTINHLYSNVNNLLYFVRNKCYVMYFAYILSQLLSKPKCNFVNYVTTRISIYKIVLHLNTFHLAICYIFFDNLIS